MLMRQAKGRLWLSASLWDTERLGGFMDVLEGPVTEDLDFSGD